MPPVMLRDLSESLRCEHCDSTQWVCENHHDRPYVDYSNRHDACGCGAGAPCLYCNPLSGRPKIDNLINEVIFAKFMTPFGMHTYRIVHLPTGLFVETSPIKMLETEDALLERLRSLVGADP
jgi:hypothetical protein